MPSTDDFDNSKRLGLFGAISVGVGAIVGGGILALAGVAFSTTGPSAVIAFAINGVIAILTALTFAEMASRFPESGGTYTFSKKVLSVDAAFTVGWVVWFASIVASVLYALGFAHFAIFFVTELLGDNTPTFLMQSATKPLVAIAVCIGLSWMLIRRAGSGGDWTNIAKVAVFAILILGGMWALFRQPGTVTRTTLTPFFSNGMGGLVQAMGYTFIALQGFDLIAAVGGEVRNPKKVLPRAMVVSLVIALVIYLPLLFVLSTVGTQGETTEVQVFGNTGDGNGVVQVRPNIREVAAANPEDVVAIAARNYLGPFGYWLVIVAAVLSMFSALQANLFAASRIASAMASDRTLPAALAKLNPIGNPAVSIAVTAALVAALVILIPDVSAAGAASSLIFLITFALAHWISIQLRLRSLSQGDHYRTPWFPLVPVVGGLACAALAIFQGIAVPTAGVISAAWLSVGGILFLFLFARRARIRDHSAAAANPELSRLRGRSQLALVPIANPDNARALTELADALVPRNYGRVVLQNVVVADDDWDPDKDPAPLDRMQNVMRQLLTTSARMGIRAEALTTMAPKPMVEIARVASLHQFQSVVMGLSNLAEDDETESMQRLLGSINADVVILRSRKDWQLGDAKKILVPIAGEGGNSFLLARLLGSLSRQQSREVTYLRVMKTDATDLEVERERRTLRLLAEDQMCHGAEIRVVRSDDAQQAICEQADASDLLILGAQRIDRRQRVFGTFIKNISTGTNCAMIVISSRR